MITTTTKVYNFNRKTADQKAEKLYRDGHIYPADRTGYCVVSGLAYKPGANVYKLTPGSMYAGLRGYVEELAQFNRKKAQEKKMQQFTTPIKTSLLDIIPEPETPKYSAKDMVPVVDDLPESKALSLNISDNNVLVELQGIKGQFSKLNDTLSSLMGVVNRLITNQEKGQVQLSPVADNLKRLANRLDGRVKETGKVSHDPTKKAPDLRGGRFKEFKKAEKKPRLTSKLINSLSPLERSIIEIFDYHKDALKGTPTDVLDTLKDYFPARKFPVNAREFTKALNRLNLKKIGVKMIAKSGSPRFLSLELIK